MANFLNRLRNDTAGATAIEYGLIVAFIAIGMMTALWGVADTSSEMWNDVASRSEEAMTN